MCYHRNSASPINALIDTFGRLPVRTREYIRHVVSIPADRPWGYHMDGTLTLLGSAIDSLAIQFHEAAHSLDLENAYPLKPLSSSPEWLQAYDKDSAVPDPYAQASQTENVAQNTVVAAFDKLVPGGIKGVMQNSGLIRNQYELILSQQAAGGDLLIPGGRCTKRMPNSQPVWVGMTSRVMRARAEVEKMGKRPDVSIHDPDLEILEVMPSDTREACKGTAFT